MALALTVSLFEQVVFPHKLMQTSIKMVFGRPFVRLKHQIVVAVRSELNLVERRRRRTLIYFYERDDVRKVEMIKPNTAYQ